ncbi:MAG: dipeptidase [Bacteroidales bacterium]|nr:dipeptidase [Bacteroidales bacterium]
MTAKELHEQAFVLDSHSDTPLAIIRNQDVSKRRKLGHIDFDRLKEGGVDGVFFAAYTSNSLAPDEATRRALQLIARTHKVCDENPKKVGLATTVREARELKAQGRTAIFIGLENGSPIQKDLTLLYLFYKMGVRYMTLTHAGNNEICDSCAPKVKRWNGVSPFGIEVIKEMNRLGMIIDVSHLSDESFYDCLKYSKAPIVATHSCCRALCNHPRNMTDQMIKDLAAAGGVIQINFYSSFIDPNYSKVAGDLCDAYDEALIDYQLHPRCKRRKAAYEKAREELFAVPRPSYKLLVDHIEHVIKLVGVRHVGLGSDFDGIESAPDGLEDASKFGVITEELKARGYSDDDIKLILGENFLRVFNEVENLAMR